MVHDAQCSGRAFHRTTAWGKNEVLNADVWQVIFCFLGTVVVTFLSLVTICCSVSNAYILAVWVYVFG